MFGQPVLSLELPSFNAMVIPTQVPTENIPIGQPELLDGVNVVAQLSQNGTYVVGRQDYPGWQYSSDTTDRRFVLHVWTLPTLSPTTEKLVPLLPSASRDIDVINRYRSAAIAIAPNELFVAVVLPNSIALYQLPDLELYQNLTVGSAVESGSSTLAWSLDSRFIASLRDDQLLVWDSWTQQIYTYEFDFTSFRSGTEIISTENGWVVHNFDEPAVTFLHCDRLLSNCQNYVYEDVIYVVGNSDGSTLLTRWDRNPLLVEIPTGVWHLQSNGDYELDDRPLDVPHDLLPLYFSPSNEFILFRGNSQAEIRHTTDWEVIQTLRSADRPAWFPDENYFSLWSPYDGISLHRLGEETPYATLDYIPMLDDDDLARLDNSVAELAVDRTGRFMLFRAGWLNLVVPIIYEASSG